jgi:hypothetical protein
VKRTLLAFFLLISTAFAADGRFVGQIVNGPDLNAAQKIVYVQGPHGASRKVDITTAKITFSPDVPRQDRESKPEAGVREGAQVRVTASQDDSGDWRASAVEIMRPAPR